MTVEEKARAYDEAVANAKRTLDCLAEDYLCTHMTKDDVRYQYAQLFPEFREGEDTMMMRKLIYGLQSLMKQGKETFAGADIEDLLAYLEKRKPSFKQISDGVIWDSGLRTGIELEKQKEQKPMERSKEYADCISPIIKYFEGKSENEDTNFADKKVFKRWARILDEDSKINSVIMDGNPVPTKERSVDISAGVPWSEEDENKVDYETVKKSVLEEFGLSDNGYDPMSVLWTIKKKWPMVWDKMLHAEMNIGDKWSKPAVEDGDSDELIRKKLISLINWSGTRWDSKDKNKFIEYLNHWGHPKICGRPISTENNVVNIPLPGESTTFDQEVEAAEKIYKEEYSKGECNEQSFKLGFQEGVDWHKGHLCDVGLIQRSWYMEGFHDGKFGREPMWYIKTGKGGPKHERNKNYTPPIGKDKILREIERELDTWEEVEDAAVKSGRGHRGSSGDLCQVTTAELCNELFWRLKAEN